MHKTSQNFWNWLSNFNFEFKIIWILFQVKTLIICVFKHSSTIKKCYLSLSETYLIYLTFEFANESNQNRFTVYVTNQRLYIFRNAHILNGSNCNLFGAISTVALCNGTVRSPTMATRHDRLSCAARQH